MTWNVENDFNNDTPQTFGQREKHDKQQLLYLGHRKCSSAKHTKNGTTCSEKYKILEKPAESKATRQEKSSRSSSSQSRKIAKKSVENLKRII